MATATPATPTYQGGDSLTFALAAQLAADPGANVQWNDNAASVPAGVLGFLPDLPENWNCPSLHPGAKLTRSVGLFGWLMWEEDEVVGTRSGRGLGQYLMIYPDARLVGVRMIGVDGSLEARGGLPDFQDLLRELR